MNIKHALSLTSLLLTLTITFACKGKTSDSATTTVDSTANDTIVATQEADSTIYGTATEDFGMSTFSMVTDKGDTLYVTRTANDGTDGTIYGSMEYGNRYAMTTRDNGESLGVLINLTELDRKLKNYRINNAHVIVGNDTVDVAKYLQ